MNTSDDSIKKNDESRVDSDTKQQQQKGVHKFRPLKTVLKFIKWAAASIASLLLLLIAALTSVIVFLRTESGENWITEKINEALSGLSSGISCSIGKFQGPIPEAFHLADVRISDNTGKCLSIEEATLAFDWSALPGKFVIAELSISGTTLDRLPNLPDQTPASKNEEVQATLEENLSLIRSSLKDIPEWIPSAEVRKIHFENTRLKKAAVGFDAVLSMQASAQASRNGLSAVMKLTRIDESCPPLSLSFTAKPSLDINVKLDTSDLALARKFIPDNVLHVPEFNFTLQAEGAPEKLKFALSAGVASGSRAGDARLHLLQLAADGDMRLLEGPSLSLRIDAGTGSSPEDIWALAGQKNGKATIHADADIALGDSTAVKSTLRAVLDNMEWGTPELASILGPKTDFQTSAGFSLSETGGISLFLEKLLLSSKRLSVESAGSLALAGADNLSGASADLNLALRLADSGKESLHGIEGDASLDFSSKGKFDSLSTEARIKSTRLLLPGLSLKNTDVSLSVPRLDIPRLIQELPNLVENASTASALPDANRKDGISPASLIASDVSMAAEDLPLLKGGIKASLSANGIPIFLDTKWNIAHGRTDHSSSGVLPAPSFIRFMLEKFDFRTDGATLKGGLSAELSSDASLRPSEGLSERLGIPAPKINADIAVNVDSWKSLAAISGTHFSGTPLSAAIQTRFTGRQEVRISSKLEQLTVGTKSERMQLRGTDILADIHDVWGTPAIQLKASAASFDQGEKIRISNISAIVSGNEKKIISSLQCSGDIEASAESSWSDGLLEVRKMKVSADARLLGMPVSDRIGLMLDNPLKIEYSPSRVFLATPLACSFLPAGKLHASGSFSTDKIALSTDLRDLQLKKFRPFVPDIPEGTVSFEAKLSGTPSAPAGSFGLEARGMLFPDLQIPPADILLSGLLASSSGKRNLELKLSIPESTRSAFGLSQSTVAFKIPFTTPSDGFSMPDLKAPLSGKIAIEGDLGKIWKLVPLADLQAAGQLFLNASVSGTAEAPVIAADLGLSKGAFTEIAQGVELRDIKLAVKAPSFDPMNGRGAPVTLALSASDGRKGRINATGRIDPKNMGLNIDGTIESLSPLHRQDISILLSGDIHVKGPAVSPAVTGKISVDKGEILLQNLPGGGITELEISDPAERKTSQESNTPGKADIRIVIPNQFFVRGYGLDCEWKGDIRIAGAFNRPAVTGTLEAVRGSLDILNKNFKLAEGLIRLDGGWPVSPALNIIMEYSASDITADITVGGTASSPKLTLGSKPTLPQDEIISQIMFGQSSGSLSHMQALQLASAAASLAGFGGSDVMGMGRKMLGVDVLKMNSDNDGENSDVSRTTVEMGTYIRDDIYVGVEQGIGKETDTSAVVEIELFPGLDAQAKTSGSKNEFGLRWKKNY